MLGARNSDMRPKGGFLHARVDTTGSVERAVVHVDALDLQPDIALATGDLVDHGRSEQFADLWRVPAPLKKPVLLPKVSR